MPSDSDLPGKEPNLELPNFGFGRRKKRAKAEEATAAADATDALVQPEAPEEASAPGDETPAPPAPPTPPAPSAPARASAVGPAPARPAARPPARPAARPASATPPAAPGPSSPPRPSPAKPPSRPAAAAAGPGPQPADGPAIELGATPSEPSDQGSVTPADVDETLIDPLSQAAAALDAPQRPRPGRARSDRRRARAERSAAKRAAKAERKRTASMEESTRESTKAPATGTEARQPDADALVARLPAIPPLLAAVLTGALAGLITVLLALGAREGCQAVRGTESCGGGAGLLAVVAILVVEVLLAANLLKAWRISDPYSTSFLGVGLVTTIAMLFFLGNIDSPWMLLVIPVLTAIMFALSWRVTVYIDDRDERRSSVEDERADEESNA